MPFRSIFCCWTLLAVASPVVWGQSPKIDNKVIATVNGEEIKVEEVDQIWKQRNTFLTPPTSAQIRQMRLEALTGMIDEKLLRSFLREQGPKIEADEIEKHLQALEKSQKAQGKTIADFLKESQQTEAQMKESIRTLLALDKYVKQHTAEADLRKYYEVNKDFFDRITVRSSHIVIRLGGDTDPKKRDQAVEKLRKIRADIAAGKIEFEAAAKEYSDCPSASKGGDIGFISRKFQNIDEAYAKAAFALKPNELSDVVITEFGVHLIKLTERKAGKPSKYEDVIEDIRDSYTEDLRQALLARLRKAAKVEITLP